MSHNLNRVKTMITIGSYLGHAFLLGTLYYQLDTIIRYCVRTSTAEALDLVLEVKPNLYMDTNAVINQIDVIQSEFDGHVKLFSASVTVVLALMLLNVQSFSDPNFSNQGRVKLMVVSIVVSLAVCLLLTRMLAAWPLF